MTEQQKQAVEAVIEETANGIALSLYHRMPTSSDEIREFEEFELVAKQGIRDVVYRPEKYGLQPINEWVSVKDRLPNKAELILAYQNGEIYTSFYDGLFRVGFTHWQPLPQPPINEREEI